MNGRRAGLALGAGAAASLPFALLCVVVSWPLNDGSLQVITPLVLLTTIASALSMGLLVLTWDRLRWQPRGRAAWSGIFLTVSVLGASLTGLLVGLASAVFSLLSDHGGQWREFSALPILPLQGLLFGVVTGFLSLSAPLGGLLFTLLTRPRSARPEAPVLPARYTPPHD